MNPVCDYFIQMSVMSQVVFLMIPPISTAAVYPNPDSPLYHDIASHLFQK